MNFTTEEAVAVEEMSSHARELGEGASLIQFGVLLVGAIAILYVSSLMIGERVREVGVFYAIGTLARTDICHHVCGAVHGMHGGASLRTDLRACSG